MSNPHSGAGACVSWIRRSRGGRAGTMRACLMVLVWAFASPGYALVAAGNLDYAVGELVRKLVERGQLQGKSVFVGADDFFEEDTGYRLRLPLSDTLRTKCRTALQGNEVDVALVESEEVRVLHGRWRRESEGELHLTLFVAEPVEREGNAGTIVSLEGGEEALLPIDEGIREGITPTLRHWGRAAVRQLERRLPGSGTYRLHVPPKAIAAPDIPRPESLGRLLLAHWKPEFAGNDRFTLAGPNRSDGELRGEAFVAGDRIVVTLTIRDRREGTEVPAKIEPHKSLFDDMMGGLHKGSGSGGSDTGGIAGRPNILVIGEDADPGTVLRHSRVFERTLRAIQDEMAGGFNVYDETAVTLGLLEQDRVRRADAELIEVCRAVTRPPLDVAVIFSLYPDTRRTNVATYVSTRVAGRMLRCRTGELLGGFEQTFDDVVLPRSCTSACLLEAVGKEARIIGRDVANVLHRRLSFLLQNPGPAGGGGLANEFTLVFNGFDRKDMVAIEESWVRFEGYVGHRPIRSTPTRREIWYRTGSSGALLERSLSDALDRLGVEAAVGFTGHTFTVEMIGRHRSP